MLLNLISTPKIALKGPKWGQTTIKRYLFNPNPKSTLVGYNKVVEPDPNPQNSPEGPKKGNKKPQMEPNKK